MSSWTAIKDMKKMYADEVEADATKLRFFCMGKELKDDLFLYSYDIADEMMIQAMIRA